MAKVLRFIPHVARVLMGLLFTLAGANILYMVIRSVPAPAGATDLSLALFKSGYMMPLIGATQFAAGLMLLLNRFVPLALVLIAPVVVNIVLFHAVLDRAHPIGAVIVVVLELYLVWAYRKSFHGLFTARATPGA